MTEEEFHTLICAYHETAYWVKVGTTEVCIKPGDHQHESGLRTALIQKHAEIRITALLSHQLATSPWCIITAENPGSSLLDPELNRHANSLLATQLQQENKFFLPSIAKATNGPASWPDEHGFWVADVSRADCRNWCQQFGQLAVLASFSGTKASIYCWHEHSALCDLTLPHSHGSSTTRTRFHQFYFHWL